MPASNEEFIKKAFKAGLTEDQVRSAVAERNQLMAQKQPAQPKQSFLNTVSNFVSPGGKLMSESAGNLLSLISPDQKKLEASQSDLLAQQPAVLARAKELAAKGDIEGARRLWAVSQNATELTSDQAMNTENQVNTGVEGLLRGAGSTALQVASLKVPVSKGATTSLGRIGQAGLTGAKTGLVLGGSEAARTADTGDEVLKALLTGAATGGVVGAGVQGGIEGFIGIKNQLIKAAKPLQKKIIDVYTGTLKENIKDKKFYAQYQGGREGVFRDSIKYDVAPTKEGVVNQLEKYKPEYGKLMTEETKIMERQGKRINIAKAFENARRRIEDKFGYDEALSKQATKWFNDNIKKYGNQTSAKPSSSNKLRVNLDQRVGDILTPDAVGADAARKAFASELRNEFKKQASTKTKDAIQKYQLLSGLSEAMQKEPKLGITEIAAAAASPGTGLMNLFEIVGAKAMRSPGLKRQVATGGLKMLSTPKVNASAINAKPFSVAAVSALQRIMDMEREKNQTRTGLPQAR